MKDQVAVIHPDQSSIDSIKTIADVERLYGVHIKGIFPGTNPNATEEEIAKEIQRSVQDLLDGKLEEVELD